VLAGLSKVSPIALILLDDIIKIIKAHNPAKNSKISWPVWSLENIINSKADIIINLTNLNFNY